MPNSVCSTGYGHNAHGVNIQNMRGLVTEKGPVEAQLPGGMRTYHAWYEVEASKKNNDFRGQLGSKLKQSNNAYKAAAEVHVADGVGRVENALKCKLGQVQMQTQALQDVLGAVNTELAKLARTQQHIDSLQAHLQDRISINSSRQQVRRDRPVRELTCDDVNRSLSRQEVLLAGLVQKLQRGTGLVCVDNGKLQDVKQKLMIALKDKMATLRVDEAVLQVSGPEGPTGATLIPNRPPTNNLLATLLSSAASPGSGKEAAGNDLGSSDLVRQATIGAARAACGSGLYPAKWQKHCDQLLTEAEQVAVDACRLRKAITQMLQECLTASQAADRSVDAAMAAKLVSTGDLRNQLSAQLQHVKREMEVTKEHQDVLKESLHAKQVPLQQLEARLAIRANRPAMESVEDEVQAALAAEAAQLKAVSTQLHARVDAAGQQIAHLNSVSVALLQHIADKETALSLEEKVALMDGRKIVAVPPSPTVLSVSSSIVSGYSGLGDSASQISAAASHASMPAGGSRLGQRPPSRAGSAIGSALGGAPGSVAGSATSSALVRIAALEKELAEAKSESAQLRAIVDSRAQSQVSGSGAH